MARMRYNLNETSLVIVEISDEDVGQHLQHVDKIRTREGMLQIEPSVVLVRRYAVQCTTMPTLLT